MLCSILRNKQGLLLIAIALVLGGCGGMPKNAEEFRQFFAKRVSGVGWMPGVVPKETFEGERPFREGSSTLQKKANEFLKVVIPWATNRGYGDRTYNPP